MIPVDNTQTIETVGQTKSIGKVTASVKNIPFLINAVTDRIYKDKPGAIVREYSTNAWDAHIQAKLPINEIVVSLPTLNDPMFRIRDFGSGLTMEQVRDIYCILGESTKRGSNDFNGQLGLGCKSAFGYGDSFMVTSWVNETKSIYNIIKGDDHKEGDVLLMSTEPMSADDRTGIEVAVPIKISDIGTIHSKAVDLYKYWTVLPTLQNLSVAQLERMMKFRNEVAFLSGSGWEIRPCSNSYGTGKSVALMGQVAYPIDWGMLTSKLAITPQKRILLEILQSNDVLLTFPIGDLKFTINREELEYTDTTYKNLESKVEEIFQTLENSVVSKFASAKSIWDAKRIYLSLFGRNFIDKPSDDDDDDAPSGEIDKAIRILDGDFYRLEDAFHNKLLWNGIVIDSPHFSKMHQWDVDRPDVAPEDIGESNTPCLVSFRRKKERVKKLRCTAGGCNRITPFNRVKVVILDGRYASITQTVARYYLLGDRQNVDKVHILRFANEEHKKAFFKHYNFDTAEFVNVSTIAEDVEAWQKSNRKVYGRGGGGGGTAKLNYIDVETEEVREEEVCLRDLEDGGVYIATSRKYGLLKTGQRDRLYVIASNLHHLVEHCGGLDRVYCLPEGRIEAKWFQKAMAEGLWVELSDYIKENVDIVVTDDMKRRYHFSDFLVNSTGLNYHWTREVTKNLGNTNVVFNALNDETISNPTDFSHLTGAAKYFQLPKLSFGSSPVDYKKLMGDILERYPMIRWMGISHYDTPQKAKLEAVVEYIQMVEVAKKILTSAPERV